MEVAELTGELFDGMGTTADDGPAVRMSASGLLTVDHYARATQVPLRQAWEDHGAELDWYRLKRFHDAYSSFKRDQGLVDFTDMLTQFVREGYPVPVDVAIVDEAQDLSLLQWSVVERAFSGVQELFIGGDIMQSVHRWAGAAEDYFANLVDSVDDLVELPVSHRLPQAVFQFAEGIAGQMARTPLSRGRPSARAGAVEWVGDVDDVDLSSGTWLVLARTRYQLGPLADRVRGQGVMYRLKGAPSVNASHVAAIKAYEALRAGKSIEGAAVSGVFSALGAKTPEVNGDDLYGAGDLGLDVTTIWHDALIGIPLDDREYYVACARRGERLTDTPRVRIDTIHGAKGAQAERVLLLTDLTYRVARGMELDPDSEHRVFYVGATRASEVLCPMAPQTRYAYPL
jgi:hypothetical protein